VVFVDFGFSTVRDWMLGNDPTAPSGMLVGTGSGAIAFDNVLLGSPLDPTRHAFASQSGLGFSTQFEHLVESTDITTGSIVREIGMLATSGGNLFFRELLPDIELFGSAEINSFLQINIR